MPRSDLFQVNPCSSVNDSEPFLDTVEELTILDTLTDMEPVIEDKVPAIVAEQKVKK